MWWESCLGLNAWGWPGMTAFTSQGLSLLCSQGRAAVSLVLSAESGLNPLALPPRRPPGLRGEGGRQPLGTAIQ